MQNAHVLLVDDEVDFVEIMIKRLTKRGLTPHGTFGAAEALAYLDAHPSTDVVILDVKMPGMDGIDALRQIKAAHPLVEVIMLTGHATVESAIEGMKRGAFDYLMKPCDLDVLLQKVSDAKDRRDAQEQRILAARLNEIADQRGD